MSEKPFAEILLKTLMTLLFQGLRTMFSDNANAIAPRRPANHKTTCILAEILLDLSRQRLATKLKGNMFRALPTKHPTNATIEKVRSQFLNPPVKTPIPMYTNTMVSVRLLFRGKV